MKSPPKRVVSGVLIADNGSILFVKRRADQTLPLKWYLPGGKVELGETDREALTREFLEELDVEIFVGNEIANFVIKYPHGLFGVHFYRIMLLNGIPSNDTKEHADVCWMTEKGLDLYKAEDYLEGDLLVAKLAFMEMRHK